MLSGKIWGTTTLLLRTPLIEMHRLDVLGNAHCSMHKHDKKWNAFVVISGTLTIEVEKAAYNLVDKTVLYAGELTTVQPGEFHRFVTGPFSAVALEIYYPESLSDDDIVRRDCGGLIHERID